MPYFVPRPLPVGDHVPRVRRADRDRDRASAWTDEGGARAHHDDCAPLDRLPADHPDHGTEHWDTPFSWTPVYGNATPCTACGHDVDLPAPTRTEAAA